MRIRELTRLVGQDVRRTRGALATAGFGIVAGTAALVFFLSLGLGVRAVLLGDVFPLDKIELEPKKGADPGLLALVLGGGSAPKIRMQVVQQLQTMPEVKRVYPKLRFAFPCSAKGGRDLLGQDIGTSEMMGDGVDPALVESDVHPSFPFEDPWKQPGKACTSDDQCEQPQYCEHPTGATEGKCVAPVPVLVSRYLVEVFNKAIAPAHGLPPVGSVLIDRANGVVFTMRLGESLLGASKKGNVRSVKARVVGISSRAIDLGLTLPIDTVRRWNEEYSETENDGVFTSLLVEATDARDIGAVVAKAEEFGLMPHDTRARDVGVLVNGVTALLSLVAIVILFMAGANIAYCFRALLWERRGEIGLYRAVGAARGDIMAWQLSLAAVVGSLYAVGGLSLGWIAMILADWLAATRLPNFPFKPESFFDCPWWLMMATVVFGALFALAGAAKPAWRAATQVPREGLIGP